MEEKKDTIAAELIALLLLVGIFMGVTIESFDVVGLNNGTTTTRVFVGNSPPTLDFVIVNDLVAIDLNAGNVTIVNCTGYVTDFNGWSDVNLTNATFYQREISADSDLDDRNYHYTNSSCSNCTLAPPGDLDTNASCTCLFSVYYYANNDTKWVCNMSISDQGGNLTGNVKIYNATQNSSGVTINPFIGIDVPGEIDYGNLSITEISAFIPANVTNYGNVPINISVRGWGGSNSTDGGAGNLSMVCEEGNITAPNQRYNLNNSGTVEWNNLTNLTNSSTQLSDFILWDREEDNRFGNDTNTTYWKIQIPSGVAGFCNGTVEFLAIDRRY